MKNMNFMHFYFENGSKFWSIKLVRKLLVFVFFVYSAADWAVEEAPRRKTVKKHNGQQKMDHTLKF